MGGKNTGLSGWFSSFLGRGKTDSETAVPPPEHTPEAVLSDHVPLEDTSSVPTFTPCEAKIPLNGSLWNLWEYHRQQSVTDIGPLQLHLDVLPEGIAMPLSQKELGLEKVRLGSFLERCAKERMGKLAKLADQITTDGPSPSLPADCWIHVSQNGMLAWGFSVPPNGEGTPLSIEMLTQILKQANVTVGIQPAVSRMFLTPDFCFKLVPMAFGIPTIPGVNGSVTEHYPREHVSSVEMTDNGNVDYRSHHYVQTIQKGDVICDITPPTEGIEGVQVSGKIVKPAPTRPAVVPKGRNTEISEDGLHLIATMDGHLHFSGGNFHIKSILEIPGDVDYSTGNIDYHGDVHIAGDVRENFSVHATGTVTIDGLVEAATVEADGDIIVTKGVLGDNKALLKSKKTVRAKYLEYCVVYSGESTIADCILDSQIYSDQYISVKTGRGTVIGGCLTAAYQIDAENIGSQSGKKTELVLGVLPFVQEEYRDNELDLEAINAELEELNRKLVFLEEHQPNDKSAKDLGNFRLRKSVLALKHDKLQKRQIELKTLTLDLGQCRLSCRTLYPPTKLSIGTASLTIEQVWKHMTAIYDTENYDIKLF